MTAKEEYNGMDTAKRIDDASLSEVTGGTSDEDFGYRGLLNVGDIVRYRYMTNHLVEVFEGAITKVDEKRRAYFFKGRVRGVPESDIVEVIMRVYENGVSGSW